MFVMMSWVSFFVPPVRLGKGENQLMEFSVPFYFLSFSVKSKTPEMQVGGQPPIPQHLQYSVLGRVSRQDSSVGHPLPGSDQYV